MNSPASIPSLVIPVRPSQHVSKVDKRDRRKLQLDEDAYVHGNDELQDAQKAAVYNRRGTKDQMKTKR